MLQNEGEVLNIVSNNVSVIYAAFFVMVKVIL